MVADDLLVLVRLGLDLPLQPIGEQPVELGALCLRERLVGRVADEQMAEPERVLVGEVGLIRTHELLAHERQEMSGDLRTRPIRRELGDRSPVEQLSLDRGPLHHRALLAGEAIESRRQKDVDRRRHVQVSEISRRHPGSVPPFEQPVVDEHLEHLLDEQRVPLRRFEDPCAGFLGELRLAQEVAQEQLGIRSGQRLEEDRGRVHLPASPGWPRVEEVGTGKTDEQDRARRARGPRCGRSGRGGSARPSARRRRRRRAVAPVRRIRTACAWPRTALPGRRRLLEAVFAHVPTAPHRARPTLRRAARR